MHFPTIPSLLFALAILTPPTTAASKPPKNAILLSNVKSLTLRGNNAQTSHRRVPSVPQLTCKGTACKHYKVDVMRCTNQGADYEKEDIQWSCVASLPKEFKLGSTDVVCEGYSSSKDEFVLKGSCGVEYKLLYTDLGEEKYGSGYFGGGSGSDGEGSATAKFLFMALFFGVAAWILWGMYQAYMNPTGVPRPARRPGAGNGGFFGGGWGGGGGGGGNGFDDPPPPYPGTGRKGFGSTPQAGQEGFRPGFWSGALGGAAAGYMAGNRGGGARQQYPNQYGQGQRGGGGWFGGGGNDDGEGSSGWGGRRSSSGNSSSGSRHESTGFGSTSRR